MTEKMPLVVRWDSFPFDCRDVKDRFQHNRFNYFHKDKDAKLLMGFWEVEQGSEVVGEVVGGGNTDEVMVVLEGRLFVSSPGMPQQIATPGDLVMCMRDRLTRVEVKERTRALFIAWNMDVAQAEQTFQSQ